MTTVIESDNTFKERKRTILTFLFATAKEQPILFRQIINKELLKRKQIMENASDNSEINEYLNEVIYNSKLKEINIQTEMLKQQMIATANGSKHPSILSIIERKLYIIEMQIDIGVYNLLKNNNVKFYFEV